ncbi:flavin monoamine oxidase family protein [Foetidibacter luteolus]|uniref:flavin monoamine oxidase family protein n=1 Tax=Foetidibacter luteolus TaxID=2608880 RepID=UPI00129B3714|nr:NAD(P)/FAD-dependent oxidoreductase [Foetidibacter luteolus]
MNRRFYLDSILMRYPLSNLLRNAYHHALRQTGAYDESRRKFIKQAALVTAGGMLAPGLLTAQAKKKNIVIVGAGIAGLNAAYQLKKAGISATVYEAAPRSGGRMFTMKNEFGAGVTTDIGGEFVDTTHEDVLSLANELGVSFYDLRTDKLDSHAYYFGNKFLEKDELTNAFKPFVKRIEQDIKSLPEVLNYTTAASFRHLDEQTITGYLQEIGISGWMYDLINVVMTREYGMEASEQSLINFLVMFSEPSAENADYSLFGDEHEVLKIKGGSQNLADAVFAKVKQQVLFRHKLTAVKKDGEQYRLSFETSANGETINVMADYVVLAIPFSVLRKISFDVDMPAEKRKCIDELGYGNSCKFVMGVSSKPWRNEQKQGYTFNDLSFGCGWDSSHMQTKQQGSFTVFGGGDFATHVFDVDQKHLAVDFIKSLDDIYPGVAKAYTGRNIKYCWQKNPFSQGGYTSLKAGQWSTLAGWEATPVGNIFFAGEHVSADFQGYMNGAAKTGRLAAEAIVLQLKPGRLRKRMAS